MRKVSRGKGFRGALNYVFLRDDEARKAGKLPGRLIGGNMGGYDPYSLAAEFGATRKILTKRIIEKPCWHQSLRLPIGERVDIGAWNQIADEYMSEIGFTDMHMRVYVLHDDDDGQHVHIVASRVGMDGSVYLGQNENFKTTTIVRSLEKKYGLRVTIEKKNDKTQPSKKELEKALRIGQKPSKMVIQDAIDHILSGPPVTAPDFVSALAGHGIDAVPNIASTGKFSGFSFSLQGHTDKSKQPIFYKGSSLGKSYTAAGLESRRFQYDPARDMPIFTGRHPQPAPDYSGEPKIRRKNGGRKYSLVIFMKFEPAPGGGQLYRWQSGAPAFIDLGDEILCAGRATDAKIRGILDLATEKGWTRIELSGSREFQMTASMEAARRGISISGNNTEIQKLWREERERTAAEQNRKSQPRSDRHSADSPAPTHGCGLRGLHECTLVPIRNRVELLLPTDARDRMGIDEQNSRDLELRGEDVTNGIETLAGSATAPAGQTAADAGNRANTTGGSGAPTRPDGDKKSPREPKYSCQDVCSPATGGDFQNDRSGLKDNEKGNRGRLAENGNKNSERDTGHEPRDLDALDQTPRQPASPDSRSNAENKSLRQIEPEPPRMRYPSPGG